MEKSFRQILSEIQERETVSVTEPVPPTPLPIYEFDFTWQAPPQKAAKSKYPAPEPRSKPTPKPQPAEKLIPLSALPESAQFMVQRLVRYGAVELEGGFSEGRLKKAYRRLVKRLHPDVSPGTAAQFREVVDLVSQLTVVNPLGSQRVDP